MKNEKSLKVLFIDDDKKRNKMNIDFLIAYEKWDIIFASTFKEALEKYEQHKNAIQIILLDVMMPMDDAMTVEEQKDSNNGLNSGLLLARRLDAMGNILPIILMTALGGLDNQKGTYGIKEVLRKPVAIDILLKKVQEYAK